MLRTPLYCNASLCKYGPCQLRKTRCINFRPRAVVVLSSVPHVARKHVKLYKLEWEKGRRDWASALIPRGFAGRLSRSRTVTRKKNKRPLAYVNLRSGQIICALLHSLYVCSLCLSPLRSLVAKQNKIIGF